jgi:hypothetical protein
MLKSVGCDANWQNFQWKRRPKSPSIEPWTAVALAFLVDVLLTQLTVMAMAAPL